MGSPAPQRGSSLPSGQSQAPGEGAPSGEPLPARRTVSYWITRARTGPAGGGGEPGGGGIWELTWLHRWRPRAGCCGAGPQGHSSASAHQGPRCLCRGGGDDLGVGVRWGPREGRLCRCREGGCQSPGGRAPRRLAELPWLPVPLSAWRFAPRRNGPGAIEPRGREGREGRLGAGLAPDSDLKLSGSRLFPSNPAWMPHTESECQFTALSRAPFP